MSTSLAKCCKEKNRLHNVWIKSRGSSYENFAKINYKSYRRILRSLIRKSENDYFMAKFNKVSGNIRKAWSVINSIRRKNKSLKFPNCVDINGTIISNRRVICHKFNEYFTNVADKLNSDKYKDFTPPNYVDFMSNSLVVGSILLREIDECEISDIIKQLDNNKSCDFSPQLLKRLSPTISPVLRSLFNRCLRLSVFPNELKIAKIIPLFKSGNINDMSNYRPISILPILSKILEKIIYKRLTDFFTENNVLNEGQFGFRQSHSTIQAVQTAVHSIVNTMNTSNYCMGIFIDFSKAFDTIKHNILLHKLSHYGIRGLAYDLISDYLSSRKQ